MPEYECFFLKKNMKFTVCTEETLLCSAYKAGISVDYRCALGSCGTCKVHLESGEVSMDHSGGLSREEIKDGYILLCCSYPLSHIICREK